MGQGMKVLHVNIVVSLDSLELVVVKFANATMTIALVVIQLRDVVFVNQNGKVC